MFDINLANQNARHIKIHHV